MSTRIRTKALDPLPCPSWYCSSTIGGSAQEVDAHVADVHAPQYVLTWGERGSMEVIRDEGMVSCTLCNLARHRSIETLSAHIRSFHDIPVSGVLPLNVPHLPWPPDTAEQWGIWVRNPGQPSAADLPPSQSQKPPSRIHGERSGTRDGPQGDELPRTPEGRLDDGPTRLEPRNSSNLPSIDQSRMVTDAVDPPAPSIPRRSLTQPHLSQGSLRPPRLSQRNPEDVDKISPQKSTQTWMAAHAEEQPAPSEPHRSLTQPPPSQGSLRPSRLSHPFVDLNKLRLPRSTQPRSSQRASTRRCLTPSDSRPSPAAKAPSVSQRSQRPQNMPSTPFPTPEGSSPPGSRIPAPDVEMTAAPPLLPSTDNPSLGRLVGSKRRRSASPPGATAKRAKTDTPPPPSIMARMLASAQGLVQGFSSPFKRRSSPARSRSPSPPTHQPPPPPAQRIQSAGSNTHRSALLNKFNFEVDIVEKIAICTECECGFLAGTVAEHAHRAHKRPLRSVGEREELKSALISLGVARKPGDLRSRRFGEAPIPGIKTVDGFACTVCHEAWETWDTAVRHCTGSHGGNNATIEQPICIIQSVLHPKNVGHRWVQVDPGNTGPGGSTDAYSLFQDTYGAELDQPPRVLPGPVNSNGVTRLAKYTNWLQHLQSHIGTEDGVTGLMSLTELAKLRTHPHYSLLTEVWDNYHEQVAAIHGGTDSQIRHHLTECPGDKETKTFELPSPDTITKYTETLVKFSYALLISMDSVETSYRFPLTEVEEKAVREMQKRLKISPPPEGRERVRFMTEFAVHLHSFIRLFLLLREAPHNPPPPYPSKFDSVLECFQALLAIRQRGILCRPQELTATSSHLKYWIRLCLLFEADQRVRNTSGLTLHEAVYELGMKNLNPSPLTVSEFTRVSGNSKVFTSLVNDSIHPPVLRVSPDYLTFTYLTTTLHLPKLRNAVQNGVVELGRRLDDLMMGIEVPIEYPKVWKDLWTSEEAGYSFMKSNTFCNERRPWLRGLLQSEKVGLTSRHFDGSVRQDARGKPLLNSHVIQDIFAKDRAFIELCLVLCYLTSSGSRGEEFAEVRLENSHHPRAFVVDQDGECWFGPQRHKTDNMTRKSKFIPAVIPPEISNLLLKYIIAVRPGITELVRIQDEEDGEVAAARQAEFLWVSEGKVFDGKKLGALLEDFTGKKCDVEVGLRPLRHIMTEVLRVYFGTKPSDEFDEGADIYSARMGRSLHTSRTNYGIDGTRNMTSDRLMEFRHASYDIHQALGVGPAGKMPLVPLRMRSGSRFGHITDPQAGVPAPVHPFNIEQLVASFTAALHDQDARMEKRLQDAAIRAVSQAFVALGHRHPAQRPLTIAPPLEPPGLPEVPGTFEQPPESMALLGKLRHFLKDTGVNFKSAEQARCLQLAMTGKTPFIAALNTGEGKSLIYQLPAFFEPDKWTLVISPYKALLSDQLNSCRKLGIKAFHWKAPEAPATETVVPPNTRIIFAALESIKTGGFQSILTDARVSRSVVDEFHEKETASDWREEWENITIITGSTKQIILLSATVPWGLEQMFATSCGFHIYVPVVRSVFQQPAHRFAKFQLPRGRDTRTFLNELQAMLKREFMTQGDQGIIFRASQEDIKQHWRNSLPECASYRKFEHRAEHERAWLSGKSTFMMSTSTCLQGINNPNCNVVIFVDFYPSMVGLAQGAGRGGRIHQETLVLFISTAGHKYRKPEILDEDPQCNSHGYTMLAGTNGCLRWDFGLAFNGKGQKCAELRDAKKCPAKGCQRCEPTYPLFKKLLKLTQVPAQAQPLASPIRLTPPSRGGPNPNRHRPYPSPAALLPAHDNPPNRAALASSRLRDTAASTSGLMEFQSGFRSAITANLHTKLSALGWLSNRLTGMCGACWALRGEFCKRTHVPFDTCALGRLGGTKAVAGEDYDAFRPTFKDYTACWHCWLPQVNRSDKHLYTRTTHPRGGKKECCTHLYAFKEIAWVVFRTRDLLDKFLQDAGNPFERDITVENFAMWLKCRVDRMINVGHLVYWLMTHYGLSEVASGGGR